MENLIKTLYTAFEVSDHPMSNIIMLYHGTSESNFAPRFGGGRDYHDYGNGFYTTEDIEAAKEWACQDVYNAAFVYSYALDRNGLSVLNLDENNTLAWISILMAHRRSRKIRGAALERCNRMIERYGIDINSYDVIRGFRANDSYFQFTADFVTDTITIETLMKSIIAGDLGLQVCVKSGRAYRQMEKCADVIAINGAEYDYYHNRYLSKDSDARKLADDYSNEAQVGQLLSEILNGGV
ncbi:MAG: DUF3990 domain-containing protein [Synergistaceae bacterium]|nr:DUF3990 domain-containing protein [Synergistaceae bacterium]